MKLDEAIVHAREVAERNRNQYKNCPSDRTDIRHQTCEECAKEHDQLAEWMEELKQYRAIGTPDGCRAAVEKQKTKKPKENEDKFYGCPTCGNILLHKWEKYPTKLMDKKNGLPYCFGCGQKLDWSDEE